MLVAALALSMFAGCSKPKKNTPGSLASNPTDLGGPTAGEPGKNGSQPGAMAPVGSGPIAELLSKQRAVTSYVQTITFNGKTIKNKVKLQNGKPVRAKMDMGKDGMMLVQYDKKAQYIVDTKNNSAMMMPVTDQTAGADSQSGIAGLDDPSRIKSLKASNDRIDGQDCWKVTKAKSDMVFWAEKKNGLPVQVKLGSQTMRFKYDKLNAVPDSEFELPAGCRVQMMPNRGAMPAPPPGH